MKFGLEEVTAIMKPHNDKIIAEARLANALHAIEKMREAASDGLGGSATYALDRLALIQKTADLALKQAAR